MVDINALPGQFYGLEVRRLREDAGWSQAELAERTGYSGAAIGYVETSQRVPTARFAAACDSAFDTGTYLSRLCQLVRRFATPHAPLDELVRSACSLQLCDPLLVPALMQTDDYARASMAAGSLPAETIDRLLDSRPRLTELLEQSPDLGVWVVLDETALYRPIGHRETLRLQLKEIIGLIDTGRVVVQVLKTTSPMVPLMRLPQIIIGFADGTSLAHVSNLMPDEAAERYLPPDSHIRAFNLLRAAALPPGISQGLIANATR